MEKLTGLVLCGGLSTRMGRDKSLIAYHARPQRYHLYRLLEPFCKKVFISCNTEQANGIETGYAFMADDEKYRDIGPMAALLTAFELYPNDNFIMIGCDYPFVRREDLLQLIQGRNANDVAVSFYNNNAGLFEPLLCIYENKTADTLFENFHRQQYSLQGILKNSAVRKVYPNEMKTIKSIDGQEDHLRAVMEIKEGRINN